MALVTPRSSNRAIFAPIAPHPRQPGPVAPSGGSVDARFAVSGLSGLCRVRFCNHGTMPCDQIGLGYVFWGLIALRRIIFKIMAGMVG